MRIYSGSEDREESNRLKFCNDSEVRDLPGGRHRDDSCLLEMCG